MPSASRTAGSDAMGLLYSRRFRCQCLSRIISSKTADFAAKRRMGGMFLSRSNIPAAEADRAAAKERPAERGLAAGDGTGHADDVARARRNGQPRKNRFLIIIGIAIRIIIGAAIAGVLIGKRQRFDRRVRALRDSKLFERLRPFHHRTDPLPRNFGLPHGVEALGRLGGLDRRFRKAGQKRRERRDVKKMREEGWRNRPFMPCVQTQNDDTPKRTAIVRIA